MLSFDEKLKIQICHWIITELSTATHHKVLNVMSTSLPLEMDVPERLWPYTSWLNLRSIDVSTNQPLEIVRSPYYLYTNFDLPSFSIWKDPKMEKRSGYLE
jgi:hypothetical protein